MKKIDLNKQLKRTSILNTAYKLFIEKGVNKTSIAEISQAAGVAKGTFYLYFRDKYDIRNKLISHESSQLFTAAKQALDKKLVNDGPMPFEDMIIFMINNIIDELNRKQSLLTFISKNLSWGVFKNALTASPNSDDVDFTQVFNEMIKASDKPIKDPELMIFLIIELVSSTSYSAILYKEPVDIETLKPHLYNSVRSIIDQHLEL